MNLLPTIGSDEIEFGSSEEIILSRYGKPKRRLAIKDCQGHAKGRQALDYSNIDFVVTPTDGLISISTDMNSGHLELWNIDISQMSPQELAILIGSKGFEASIKNHIFDDCDVESIDCGVIASFCENVLDSIEIYLPNSKSLEGATGYKTS